MHPSVYLIHPPLWDVYAPPASTPSLTAYLQQQGIECRQVDLNQVYFKSICERILHESLSDASDPEGFSHKLPFEHRVVLSGGEFHADPLAKVGLEEADLTFDNIRSGLDKWGLPQLNVVDALIHYGYFVREGRMLTELIESESRATSTACELTRLFEHHCLREIHRAQPIVVGFSISGSDQLAAAVICSARLRREYAGRIVWGGSYVGNILRELLASQDVWWQPLVDHFVLGEGEQALHALAAGRRLPNSVISSGDVGKSNVTYGRIEQLDDLAPPSFDDLPIADGYLMAQPVLPYQASRGCYWGLCSFCDHEEGYRTNYREKDARKVARELAELSHRYQTNHFQFADEALKPEWLSEFLKSLASTDPQATLRWFSYLRIDKSLTPALLQDTYRRGCRLVLYGVETFNARLMRLMKKGTSPGLVERILKDTHAADLRQAIWLISGFPTQTMDELYGDMQKLSTVSSLIAAAFVGPYRLEPNSDIGRDPSLFGVVSCDTDDRCRFVSRLNEQLIDSADMLKIYREEYYPLAIRSSLSHNRYLLFNHALKNERGAST